MSTVRRLYSTGLTLAIPLAAGLSYRGFLGRDPEWHLSRKIQSIPPVEDSDRLKIWLHGASVGEIGLVNRLIDWLKELGLDRDEILVTAQTRSGLNQVPGEPRRLMCWDFESLLRPFLNQLPRELPLVVLETELWPNLFSLRKGRVSILNGRVNPGTFDWYWYCKPLIKQTLSCCNQILTRSREDRNRFLELGADPSELEFVGSLKWSGLLETPPDLDPEFPRFSGDSILVAGSTHPGEEKTVLEAIRETGEQLYLAPRHLDRVETVISICREYGYSPVRSTEVEGTRDDAVIVVDEIGKLSALYGMADRAFVGGSLNPEVGGHNILEPLIHGVPVLVGPHTDRIRQFVDRLAGTSLLRVVEDAGDLTSRGSLAGSATISQDLEELKAYAGTVRDRYLRHLEGLLE